jgi:hypothetical protein
MPSHQPSNTDVVEVFSDDVARRRSLIKQVPDRISSPHKSNGSSGGTGGFDDSNKCVMEKRIENLE